MREAAVSAANLAELPAEMLAMVIPALFFAAKKFFEVKWGRVNQKKFMHPLASDRLAGRKDKEIYSTGCW